MDHRHNLFVSSNGSVESGWTVYLEDSSSMFTPRIQNEELDLSMLSDASSGPPIFRENEPAFPENESGRCFCDTTPTLFPKGSRKMKGGDGRRRPKQTASFLDDTASSGPNFNFHNSESSTSCQNPSGNQRQKNQLSQFRRQINGKRSGLK
ncbi:hypothetical protein SDJN02_16237, partial [Cucurbita argyrosperma subsp. argyrosperma]